MTGKPDAVAAAISDVRRFIERALVDFDLTEAFEARPEHERKDCLQWLETSVVAREQERRVTRLLDDLVRGNPLPNSRFPGVWR